MTFYHLAGLDRLSCYSSISRSTTITLTKRVGLAENIVKVVEGNQTIVPRRSPLDHLQQLGIAHGLAELSSDPLELVETNVASFLHVKQMKDLGNILSTLFFSTASTNLQSKNVEELVEIEITRPVLGPA